MTPSGAARLAGIFGWPISHSRSPQLHGYWLTHYRIDGAYVPLGVRPEDFPTRMNNQLTESDQSNNSNNLKSMDVIVIKPTPLPVTATITTTVTATASPTPTSTPTLTSTP